MHPRTEILRGKIRRRHLDSTTPVTPVEVAPSWDLISRPIKEHAEQWQLARVLADAGAFRMIRSDIFIGLSPEEVAWHKAEGYKRAATNYLNLATQTTDSKLRQTLINWANHLSEQGEVSLGKDPVEGSPPFEEVWLISQLQGILPTINNLIGTGSIDAMKAYLQQVPGFSKGDKVGYMTEAIRVRRGLVNELSREHHGVTSLSRKKDSNEITKLKKSLKRGQKYIDQIS